MTGRMMILTLAAALMGLAGSTGDVYAQEAQEPQEEPKKEEAASAEKPPAEQPPAKKKSKKKPKATNPPQLMHKAIHDLSQDLGPEELRHFYVVYNNYNLIHAVETVRGDVSKAIDACGENNPDMEENLRQRFGEWTEAVDPKIKEAKATLDNMVLAQDYAKKREIEKIFKLIRETREYPDPPGEKVPVTSPEACEFLLKKMDETQEVMLSLLKATLISFPRMFPDYDGPNKKL